MNSRISMTFIRYIASYLVVLILPVAVTVFISYAFFMDVYRKEVIDGKMKSLSLQMKEFELKLKQMENIVRQLEIESTLFNHDLQYSIPARLILKEKLSGYRLISRYVDDILYYRRGDQMIYAATGTYNTQNYGVIMEKHENWPSNQMQFDLDNVQKPEWRPVEKITDYNGVVKEAATFMYSLPYYSEAPYATVLFRIPAEKLFEKTGNHQDEGSFLIVNRNRSVIFRTGNIGNSLNDLITNVLEQETKTGGLPFKDEKGIQMLATFAASENYDWYIINISPVYESMSEVTRVRNTFSILIWVSIFLGTTILYLFAYLNYKPLRRLKDHAMLMLDLPQSPIKRKASEVELAHEALDTLASKHNNLNARIEEQRQVIRDFLLIRLVSGEFRNMSEFNLRAQENGIKFNKIFLRVIVFSSQNERIYQLQQVSLVEACMRDGMEAFAYLNGGNRMVLVIATDNRNESIIKDKLRQACEQLKDTGIFSIIGVGNCYSETSRLHVSFMEASTALEYAFTEYTLSEYGRMLFFSEVFKESDDYYNYPETEMQEIMSAVINDRVDQLKATLEQVFKKQKKRRSQLFSRILAYETINTIFRAVHHKNQGFIGVERYCSNILEFNNASSTERMWEIVLNIAEDVSRKHMPSYEDSKKPTIQLIIEYMNCHFDKQDFSIQQTARYFHMSVNNFSQHFKRQTGQTPLEYINNLRISKAKKILAESDKTIKEIVSNIGYLDESGFIRRFKENAGMTPGEYRNKYRTLQQKIT